MRFFVSSAAVALIAAMAVASAGAEPTGDEILAGAAQLDGVQSYTVPVQFDVHLRKPIGLHANVGGVVDYRAPRDGALVITTARGLIGHFFRGTYHVDLVPQAWPALYHVTSVGHEVDPIGPVTVLTAVPRGAPGDITRVTFRVGGPQNAPIGATWQYSDGSSIAFSLTNGPAPPGSLPRTATIRVDKPRYKIDATVTYGTYALNVPIDPAVFATK